jgi:hypothetical protein
MDMEDEIEFDAADEAVEARSPSRTGLQSVAWRRIEEARERRQLRQALEDFADYDV